MGAIFVRRGSAHVDNVITKRCSKQPDGCPWRGGTATSHTVALRILPNPASGTYTSAHRNSPETFRNLPPEPTVAHARTLRNLPELAPRTYTTPAHPGTLQNLPEPACLRNLHHHTPELSGNLPEPPSGTYNSTRPNSPEPSGTCLRNLHHHTPELSGNLPEPPSGTYNSTRPNSPEPSGTCPRNVHYTSTHRNSPEPSGTCLRNLEYPIDRLSLKNTK